MYCIKCGKELPEGSAYCPCCGSAVGSGNTMGETTNKEVPPVIHQKEKLITEEFWIMILMGVAVSAFFYIMFYIEATLSTAHTSSGGMLKFVVMIIAAMGFSLKLVKTELKDFSKKWKSVSQLRGFVGVSLGSMLAEWEVLSSFGKTYDNRSTANGLLIVSILCVVIIIVIALYYRNKGFLKSNVTALFYISCVYNLLFYLTSFVMSINNGAVSDITALISLIMIFTPGIVAIITGICFYRCRGREV